MSFGGGPASWVASYLGYEAPSFGKDLEEIQITLISSSKRFLLKPKLTEPKVLFRRNSKTLYVDWPFTRLEIDEITPDYLNQTTQDKFKCALEDIYEALDWALNKRIKPKDDFDIASCMDFFANARKITHATDDDYRKELKLRDEKYTTQLRTHSMHQKIDTDWDVLHPDAAHLLFHPDLWSETDPRMPQGNEFGKYVLINFNDLHGLPLSDVLEKVGLKPYEIAAGKDQKTQALQTEIGLIFAYIKKTGTVSPNMVRDLLDRMEMEDRVKNSFWVYRAKGETSSHFQWMQYYLTELTNETPRVFPDH